MTHAERQARYRTKQAEGAPTLRYRKPIDRRSRLQRWHDAVTELQKLQGEYQGLARRLAAQHGGQWYGRGLAHDLRARLVRTAEHRSAPGVWTRLNRCTM